MTLLFIILGGIAGGWLGHMLDRKAERDREAAGIQPQEECTATTT